MFIKQLTGGNFQFQCTYNMHSSPNNHKNKFQIKLTYTLFIKIIPPFYGNNRLPFMYLFHHIQVYNAYVYL